MINRPKLVCVDINWQRIGKISLKYTGLLFWLTL